VTTGSTFGKGKVIERMMKKYNYAKSDAIYIGDEIRDIQAARSIKIRIVAVAWGFNAAATLIDRQPDALITKPKALISALAYLYPDRSARLACF
jgi:phosphoglycolate phosphatase